MESKGSDTGDGVLLPGEICTGEISPSSMVTSDVTLQPLAEEKGVLVTLQRQVEEKKTSLEEEVILERQAEEKAILELQVEERELTLNHQVKQDVESEDHLVPGEGERPSKEKISTFVLMNNQKNSELSNEMAMKGTVEVPLAAPQIKKGQTAALVAFFNNQTEPEPTLVKGSQNSSAQKATPKTSFYTSKATPQAHSNGSASRGSPLEKKRSALKEMHKLNAVSSSLSKDEYMHVHAKKSDAVIVVKEASSDLAQVTDDLNQVMCVTQTSCEDVVVVPVADKQDDLRRVQDPRVLDNLVDIEKDSGNKGPILPKENLDQIFEKEVFSLGTFNDEFTTTSIEPFPCQGSNDSTSHLGHESSLHQTESKSPAHQDHESLVRHTQGESPTPKGPESLVHQLKGESPSFKNHELLVHQTESKSPAHQGHESLVNHPAGDSPSKNNDKLNVDSDQSSSPQSSKASVDTSLYNLNNTLGESRHLQFIKIQPNNNNGSPGSPSEDVKVSDDYLNNNAKVLNSVEGLPEIMQGPCDVTVKQGQTATFTTLYKTEPEIQVTWMKRDQELLEDASHTVVTGDGVSTLTISNITELDCDKYTVFVKNIVGVRSDFASLAVKSEPEPPAGRPNVTDATGDAATLSWYGPTYDGGAAVSGYQVEARQVGDDWVTLTDSCHSTSYIAQGLVTGVQYEFRVRAQNVHGLSEPSKPSYPITTQPRNDFINEENTTDESLLNLTSSVEVQPGELFEQLYEQHKEVGKGRFGVVFHVTEKSSRAKRAAKVVRCIKAADKVKVREEVSIMSNLRHPKLMQIASAFERRRDIIIIMEFIDGGELFERVVADDFTLTEHDCILFLRQICEGLQYMHSKYILHLDLKPENVLCLKKNSNQIKIIDFGLARRLNPEEPLRVLFGTPEFIAPEILNYEPISFTADMWSVGVICYVLLSGLSPFMGESDAETFNNITHSEFDFEDDAFSSISEDAKEFITSLLIKEPKDRLLPEGCLQHSWLAQNEGTMNKVVLSTDKLKKFITRRKWQKTGNAIRALGRMAIGSNSSESASPTRQPSTPNTEAFSSISMSSVESTPEK